MANNMLNYRLVAIGKTGVGKSRTCNTILKKDLFEASSEGSSVTEKCKKAEATVFDKKVLVVDTPGFLDTFREGKEFKNELKQCVCLSSPGPHAILLLVKIGRFTDEDVSTVDEFVKLFGEELYKYVIILFTHFDNYKFEWKGPSLDAMNFEQKTEFMIQTFVTSLPENVRKFIRNKCNGRVIGFDNRLVGLEADKQLQQLFKLIEKTVTENGDTNYTNEDYEKAEEIIQQDIKEREERLKREFEEEETKLQRKIQIAVNESQKKELNKTLEELKKEFDEKIKKHNLRDFVLNTIGNSAKVAEVIFRIVSLFVK